MKSTVNTFCLVLATFILFSCSGKKNSQKEEPPVEKKVSGHKWFALDKNGFSETDAPQKAPVALQKPWTEAVRISSLAVTGEETPLDVAEGAAPKVFALVNRLGIIEMGNSGDEAIRVFKDEAFFADRTADKLVFMNGTPIFALYRNSYFNEEITSAQKFRPFLIQFSKDSGIYFPILTYENLSLSDNSEVNDFCWNGKEWFCSVKTFSDSETDFSYLKFRPETALLSISPEKNLINIEKSSEKEFRVQRSPQQFSQAPERLQKLLRSIPQDFDFYVECKTAGGPTPRDFIHSKKIDTKNVHRAAAQIAGTWIGALFEDGTLYLNGALYGKKILNGGNTVALRLPKLPDTFKYSDFGISGTKLYASWEETDFYKTGRAGFICVDLEKILYSRESGGV